MPLPPPTQILRLRDIFDLGPGCWVITQQLPLPVPSHLKGRIGGLTEERGAIKDF